ncbi:restriction endonuclease subunit S, partial [Aeromonas caviae]|uniref:restriction endonuclease subunit S n=1 Tax=Aeromonas caviae TaxID=648 RepID=UPI00403F2069
RGYKQTEVGVIPNSWSIQRLANITTLIIDGTHHTPVYTSHGVPFLRVTDIQGEFDETRFKHISVFEHEQLIKRCHPQNGDLLLSKNGTIGIPRVVDWDWEFSVFVSLALIKLKRECLNVHYLEQFFRSDFLAAQLAQRSKQGTVTNLHLEEIREILVPLPPSLKEQTAIANVLSDSDALIGALEQLIAKKQAIKSATMQQLLTSRTRLPAFALRPDGTPKGYKPSELGDIPEDWVVAQLGEIVKLNMGQSPSSSNYNNKGIGMPLIQGNADILNRKTIIRNYTSQITKKAKKGDLILSVRAPVGEVAKAEFDCCIGRGVCAVQYKNDYLYQWLVSFETEWDKFSKGSTFDSINSEELRHIELIMPSDEEQTAITTILSDMDNELQALTQKLEKARALKQGMMQQLLTGKIRLPLAAGA